MRFDIPGNIQTVLECLRKAGFRALPVGGCVRDLLLGHAPHDWDITTSATPAEMSTVFSDFRMLKIGQGGAKHGTITVVIDHVPIEVTTFRQDGAYSDGRRPDAVYFSRTLESDLARRDFTINAMCLGEDGNIIDLFGGQQDLQKGIICAIGEPDRRFGEDALRILRALRFAAVLRFDIEYQTARSMLYHMERLAALSAERVRAEFEKLLCASDCTRVLMDYHEIICAILPELKATLGLAQREDYHCHDVYTHTAYAVGFAPPEPVLRVALLLHDIGKPLCADGHGHFYGHAAQSVKLADVILRRLKFGNAARGQILFLVQQHGLALWDADRNQIKKWLSKFGFAAMRQLLSVQKADIMAQRVKMSQERLAGLERAQCLMADIVAQQLPLTRTELAISGRDIIASGISPGPQLGALLDLLLQKVMDETLPNEPDALLEYVRLHRQDEVL
ncbi:MAG: CCA tRNA nucleotidyltransferase [Candidatus Fimivivens sp.]